MFPEEDMPGVDLVIPNIAYLRENQHKVRAILITHGHEDHTGAVPFVLRELNVPVYAPRLAHGLIEVKLRDHRILSASELHAIEPGETFAFGVFRVEFLPRLPQHPGRHGHRHPHAPGASSFTPATSSLITRPWTRCQRTSPALPSWDGGRHPPLIRLHLRRGRGLHAL